MWVSCLTLLSALVLTCIPNGPSSGGLSILEIESKVYISEEKSQGKACSLLETICSTPKQLHVQMAAIPHTASSSTDRLFHVAKNAWNTSVASEEKGFSCPNPAFIQFIPQCKMAGVPECVLGKLRYKRKAHMNYNKLSSSADILFTILREPE